MPRLLYISPSGTFLENCAKHTHEQLKAMLITSLFKGNGCGQKSVASEAQTIDGQGIFS